MSDTLNLRLWSNYNPAYSQKTNIGESWVIDPTGPIVEPTGYVDAVATPGLLKVYEGLDPDCLVIHWIFPNIHVGHVLWISRAPLRLTDFQIATVRAIERQLAKDWERITRREFAIMAPPRSNLIGISKSIRFPLIYRLRVVAAIATKTSPKSPARLSSIMPTCLRSVNMNLPISASAFASTANKVLPIIPAETACGHIRSIDSATTTSAEYSAESAPIARKRRNPRPALCWPSFLLTSCTNRYSL